MGPDPEIPSSETDPRIWWDTHARRHVHGTALVVGGLTLFLLMGLLPAAVWSFVALGCVHFLLWGYLALRVRRRLPARRTARLIMILFVFAITVGIHLLGELGIRFGVLLYFLYITPGQDRQLSGLSPLFVANVAAVLFAGLRLVEWMGWVTPRFYWQGTPESAGLEMATVLCVGLFLNCAGLLSGETDRVLLKRQTDLEALNRTLAERNAQLERLQREFEYYASGVAHDLANPLAAAMEGFGALEALLPPGEQETDELRQFTRRNLARALEMLGGLREITKTVAAEEAFVAVGMGELVAGVLAEFELRLRAKGIRLEVAEGLPVVVVQRAKMVQVWRNLIGNAVKYMPGPRAEIRVTYGRTARGHEFGVVDSGVGIPREYHGRIFEPFERVPGTDAVADGGMGLGLTLVKRVVEAHGGVIEVESTPGKGTTFRFTLPERISLVQAAAL